MPLTEQNVKLLQSERLSDYDDGGGRPTGREVANGQVNNLFPDISALDRTYGRVSLRKAFVAVQSVTQPPETLYGTHVIVAEPPADPLVHVTLFDTGSWTDERADAQRLIENFVISGPESRYILYGNHVKGQRTVRVYCDRDAPDPDVGEVYHLVVEDPAYTPVDQYVRVAKIRERRTQTFVQMLNAQTVTFERDVILMEITDALRHDFAGGEPTYTNVGSASPTKVRTTQVADAARYYGTKPLAQPAALGDLTVKVDDPYAPLVPSVQSETAVVDMLAGMNKVAMVPSGPEGALSWTGTLQGTEAPDYPAVCYLGSPCAKGSVTVTIGSVTLADDGHGGLAPPPNDTSGYAGTVDYATGLVTVTRNQSWSATVSIAAQPAARVTQQGHTHEIAISQSNRGYTYVPNLKPVPAPGTLTVDYRALGRWIRLTDQGDGTISGRPGEGSGTVDYATGSVSVTLGALPDVGSSVIFSWGTPVHYERRDGDATIDPPAIRHTLAQGACDKSSLTITWTSGGVQKTATDDGLGNLTGDGSGTVDYLTGEIVLVPNAVPDGGTTVTFDYSVGSAAKGSTGPVAPTTGLTYDFTIGSLLPIKPGSVKIGVILKGPWGVISNYYWTDDGAGNVTGAGLLNGTIDYNTGAVSLTINNRVTFRYYVKWQGKWLASELFVQPEPYDFSWWCQDTSAASARQDQLADWRLTIDLTPGEDLQVVAGSVRFEWGGQTYVDREGRIYRQVDPATNSGLEAGTIDYATGLVTLTDYVAGGPSITITSLLVAYGRWYVVDSVFRAPGSPLKPASTTVRATRIDDGTEISATADANGNLVAAGIEGHVDTTTGVISVQFGAWVQESTLTDDDRSEGWYDPANIQPDGTIWKPYKVDPSSIYLNTVVYTYVPLSEEVLGIDPVRLPQDGRVPIYRPGDVVVVHNTQTTEDPAPTGGATVTLRPKLAYVRVHDYDLVQDASPTPGGTVTLRAGIVEVEVTDANGVEIPPSWYTVDYQAGTLTWDATLDLTGYALPVQIVNRKPLPTDRYTVDLQAGTLTWANPLDLTGYGTPLRITHRIEDMALVADVQITGEVTLVAALEHDYTAGDSYLSSALVIGDLQARVEHVFDQATWTGEWSDQRIGSEASASYNDVLYPIEVTNTGAVEERWRLEFTTTTTVNVIGEVYGQVLTGASITADIAPVNPETGEPYFVVKAAGWGGGWSVGNVLRFNTRAANHPLWLARTTLQGQPSTQSDDAVIQIRGDAD